MRLIDADELIKDRVSNDPVVIAALCEPTVDAVPVVHGKWIGYKTNSFKNSCEGLKRRFYLCSICRTANAIRRNYCPNCGAKMDGK